MDCAASFGMGTDAVLAAAAASCDLLVAFSIVAAEYDVWVDCAASFGMGTDAVLAAAAASCDLLVAFSIVAAEYDAVLLKQLAGVLA